MPTSLTLPERNQHGCEHKIHEYELAYHGCDFASVLATENAEANGQVARQQLTTLRIKSLWELDRPQEAVAEAQAAIERTAGDGYMHYLLGVSHYLARTQSREAEEAFLISAGLDHPGGDIGLAFLTLSAGDAGRALAILAATTIADPELRQIATLLEFHCYMEKNLLEAAQKSLRNVFAILAEHPSLLRYLWAQLSTVSLLRAQGRFDGACDTLDHLMLVLTPARCPRLWRNGHVEKRLISEHRCQVELRLLDTNIVSAKNHDGLSRKPMLNLLLEYLQQRGTEGACKEAIVNDVWQEQYNPMIHNDRLYKAISRLRRLIGDDNSNPHIIVQKGRNYVFLNHVNLTGLVKRVESLNLPQTPDIGDQRV